MARKKIERVLGGGFTWFLEPPVSQPERERWRVALPMVSVTVTDYGQSDPRGGYFRGWRVVAGAPSKEEYHSRDEAMQGASDEIKRQARRKLFEHGKAIEDARTLKQRCEEAGVKV